MVGKTGFEPATPWSQTKCSTKLSYFPRYINKNNGAPGRSRIHNLLIRSQMLYPIELRAHNIITGAENRNRTGTVVTYRRILSPVRLPVPPPRHNNWSGRRDSNPRPRPWQGRYSTTELLPHQYKVRVKGVEPPRPKALDPKSSVSASSATPAIYISIMKMVSHAGFEPATL